MTTSLNSEVSNKSRRYDGHTDQASYRANIKREKDIVPKRNHETFI